MIYGIAFVYYAFKKTSMLSPILFKLIGVLISEKYYRMRFDKKYWIYNNIKRTDKIIFHERKWI
jgi:hypothetical protein